MYLFFDTETTGLSHHNDHVVQIAWALTDKAGNIKAEECHVIRPNGYSIPSLAARIHGITTAKACEIGQPLGLVLQRLSDAATRATIVVAHNLYFDLGILQHDYKIAELPFPLHGKTQICTMRLSSAWCRLPKLNGSTGFKYPRLEELHYRLFGEGFDGAHDALADTHACRRCYFELVRLGVITPPSIPEQKKSIKLSDEEVFAPSVSRDTALQQTKALAEQGVSSEQHNLGTMYIEGCGVEQNYEQAAYWYRKAAEQGNADGQCGLGLMYNEGCGVKQNYEQAVYWYRKAAEQGNADAQESLRMLGFEWAWKLAVEPAVDPRPSMAKCSNPTLAQPDEPKRKEWSFDSKTKILANNLMGIKYTPNRYEHHSSSGVSGFRIFFGPDTWANDEDVDYTNGYTPSLAKINPSPKAETGTAEIQNVAHFAKELGLPTSLLLEQFQSAGISKKHELDPISEQDKAQLLKYLRQTYRTD